MTSKLGGKVLKEKMRSLKLTWHLLNVMLCRHKRLPCLSFPFLPLPMSDRPDSPFIKAYCYIYPPRLWAQALISYSASASALFLSLFLQMNGAHLYFLSVPLQNNRAFHSLQGTCKSSCTINLKCGDSEIGLSGFKSRIPYLLIVLLSASVLKF